MFESDDFDQVLSQYDFPEFPAGKPKDTDNLLTNAHHTDKATSKPLDVSPLSVLKCAERLPISSSNYNSSHCEAVDENTRELIEHKIPMNVIAKVNKPIDQQNPCVVNERISNKDSFVSPKQNKRKIINSYFDHQSKRKFPGPAGLLSGALDEPKDESICQMELLSQDIDCTQHNLQRDLFESPLWSRLLSDLQEWKLPDVDSIKAIKQQALNGNLRRRKAQTVTAFVEAVDRSVTDPLIILRDSSGSIKCTLHRDAWSTFSAYIVSEYCALILQKPTVLTTGSAFKKHYLNITLSNILAIYSSAVLKEDGDKTIPQGYEVIYEEEFTVIKTEKCSDSTEIVEQNTGAEDLFDGLDSIFSDDIF